MVPLVVGQGIRGSGTVWSGLGFGSWVRVGVGAGVGRGRQASRRRVTAGQLTVESGSADGELHGLHAPVTLPRTITRYNYQVSRYEVPRRSDGKYRHAAQKIFPGKEKNHRASHNSNAFFGIFFTALPFFHRRRKIIVHGNMLHRGTASVWPAQWEHSDWGTCWGPPPNGDLLRLQGLQVSYYAHPQATMLAAEHGRQ